MDDEPRKPTGRPKKRGNGQGDPYFDNAKQLWYVAVWIDGKRHRRSAPTKAAAFLRQAELRKLRDQRIDIPPERLTVGAWVKRWIESKRAAGLDPLSIRRYEEHWRLRIVPMIGKVGLLKLTSSQVQNSVDALLLAGDVSRSTVAFYRTVLSSALEDAVRKAILPRNPCDGVLLGRQSRARERRALTIEEAKSFFAKARGSTFEPIYYLAIATGGRRGELLGLKWSNIHWPTGQITISGQVKRLGPGGNFGLVDETKGRKNKTLRLPGVIVDMLRTQREKVKALRKAAGADWAPFDLVFPTSTGRPIKPDRVTAQFGDIAMAAGLPDDVDFHTLRHSAATYYTMLGLSSREVQAILGHASINTTEGYTHILPAMSEDAAQKMDTVIRELAGEG